MRIKQNINNLFTILLAIIVFLSIPISNVFADDLAIDNLEFSSLSGSQLQLQLDLNGPAKDPKIFQTDNPSRIAMDFVGVKSNLAKKSFPINQGPAGTVYVVEAAGRTRVVVNLLEKVPYESKIVDNKFYLIMKPGTVSGNSSPAIADNRVLEPVANEPPKSSATGNTNANPPKINPVKDLALRKLLATQNINNIDFKRGTKGEGQLLITLTNPNSVVDAKQRGGKVMLNFMNTHLPESLAKVFDVSDFATPVQKVEVRPAGENVSFAITPNNDSYEYSTYQADNVFTVEFRPLTQNEKEELKKERFPYVGEKLSLNFQDIEVRSVLQILGDFTELNIVANDSVVGNVSLRLSDVPWDQALDMVLKLKGLGKRQNGNVIMVAPLAEIMKNEQDALESQKVFEMLEPLKTEYIQINYARASEICSILMGIGNSSLGGQSNGSGVVQASGPGLMSSSSTSTIGATGSGGCGSSSSMVNSQQQSNTGAVGHSLAMSSTLRLLSDRGVAIIDARTNTVIVKDTSKALEEVRKMIKILDVPIRQVMVETRIVIANTSFIRDLGTNFGVRTQAANAAQNASTDRGLKQLGYFMNGAALAATGGTSGVAMTLAAGANHLLDLEINAMQTDDKGEQIANPRVMTTDRVKAIIKQGVQIPYTTQTANQIQTSFVDAVLQLEVTPQITPGGSVIMDLAITDDSEGPTIITGGNETVEINRKQLNARVQVEDGETVVLGGVYTSVYDNSHNLVPWFSDLPGIGWLFRFNHQKDDKQELLIFVTPKIVKTAMKTN